MPRHRPRATRSKITNPTIQIREASTVTSNLGRLYATALAMVVFFFAWAVIAARPWVPENEGKQDPRLVALNVREQRLRKDAVMIKKIVNKRWATYRVALTKRKHLIAVRAKQNAARARAHCEAGRVSRNAIAIAFCKPRLAD